MTSAAVGFRSHTGWTAAVVLAGPADAPRVVARTRINLLARGVPFECYHAAANLPAAKAEAVIERALATATDLAREALLDITNDLRATKDKLIAAGIVLSSARPLLSVEDALSSHTKMHTAEGLLYRQALMDAAKRQRLHVVAAPERDLPGIASDALGMSAAALRGRVGDLGRELGAPWALDQKHAALVAWLALASKP
jgi:hypothetical protein